MFHDVKKAVETELSKHKQIDKQILNIVSEEIAKLYLATFLMPGSREAGFTIYINTKNNTFLLLPDLGVDGQLLTVHPDARLLGDANIMRASSDYVIYVHSHPFQYTPTPSSLDISTITDLKIPGRDLVGILIGKTSIIMYDEKNVTTIYQLSYDHIASLRDNSFLEFNFQFDAQEVFDVWADKTVTIVGAGAVGSMTAYLLSKLPLAKLILMDFDQLEPKNTANQFVDETALYGVDLGKFYKYIPKVEALKATLNHHFAITDIETMDVDASQRYYLILQAYRESNVIVLATDSARSRYKILRNILYAFRDNSYYTDNQDDEELLRNATPQLVLNKVVIVHTGIAITGSSIMIAKSPSEIGNLLAYYKRGAQFAIQKSEEEEKLCETHRAVFASALSAATLVINGPYMFKGSPFTLQPAATREIKLLRQMFAKMAQLKAKQIKKEERNAETSRES